MTDAAYLELFGGLRGCHRRGLVRREDGDSRLAETNPRGERLSESEYQQMVGRLMRRETEIEILRENVARFKSRFRTH